MLLTFCTKAVLSNTWRYHSYGDVALQQTQNTALPVGVTVSKLGVRDLQKIDKN